MINLLVVVLQKSFTQQHHNHPHQPPFPLAGGDQDVAPVVRPPGTAGPCGPAGVAVHVLGSLAWELAIWTSSQRWYMLLAEARHQQERKTIGLPSCRTVWCAHEETSPGFLLLWINHTDK